MEQMARTEELVRLARQDLQELDDQDHQESKAYKDLEAKLDREESKVNKAFPEQEARQVLKAHRVPQVHSARRASPRKR